MPTFPRRPMRSSPSTCATLTSTPTCPASAQIRSASPAGLRPPAFETTLIPRSAHVPEHLFELAQERVRPALAAPALARAPQDQHRELGEVLAREHVDGAVLHH